MSSRYLSTSMCFLKSMVCPIFEQVFGDGQRRTGPKQMARLDVFILLTSHFMATRFRWSMMNTSVSYNTTAGA